MTYLQEIEHHGPVAAYMLHILILESEPDGSRLSRDAEMMIDYVLPHYMSLDQRAEARACLTALNEWEEEHGIE